MKAGWWRTETEREKKKSCSGKVPFFGKIRAARAQRDIPSWVEKKKEVESDIIVQSFFTADDLASELATNGRKSRLTFFLLFEEKKFPSLSFLASSQHVLRGRASTFGTVSKSV